MMPNILLLLAFAFVPTLLVHTLALLAPTCDEHDFEAFYYQPLD